jgi:hypothetical protein
VELFEVGRENEFLAKYSDVQMQKRLWWFTLEKESRDTSGMEEKSTGMSPVLDEVVEDLKAW